MTSIKPIPADVRCSAVPGGEPGPHTLTLWGKTLTVTEIVDRWLAHDFNYFKVRASDGAVYIVRNDVSNGTWELTMYSRLE